MWITVEYFTRASEGRLHAKSHPHWRRGGGVTQKTENNFTQFRNINTSRMPCTIFTKISGLVGCFMFGGFAQRVPELWGLKSWGLFFFKFSVP